jgi:hypothetical protein
MRRTLIALLVVVLMTGIVVAQGNPSIEIVLRQPMAEQGAIVTADVIVRGAENVGGADVGITVDSTCLRIVEREPGDYLPTTDTEGAFSAFSEINEHDTRLAVALTDRTRMASGEGVFYSVQLEVTCAEGTAPLTVSYAKLSTYEDPDAEAVSLISFSLDEGTLNASGAELAVVPAGQVTLVPTRTPAPIVGPTEEAQPTATSPATAAAPVAPTGTSSSDGQPSAAETGNQTLLILVAVLLMAVVILVVIVLWLLRRTRRQQDENE